MDSSIYSNYYVCYFNIYDFNEKTLDNRNSIEYAKELSRVSNVVKKMMHEYEDGKKKLNCGITANLCLFSNYFIVSYGSQGEAFNNGIYQEVKEDLIDLQSKLALQDIWIKGGIAFGKFYSHDDINIGPAMNAAADITKKGNGSECGPVIYVDNSIASSHEETYIDWLYSFAQNNIHCLNELECIVNNSPSRLFCGYSEKVNEIVNYIDCTKKRLGRE